MNATDLDVRGNARLTALQRGLLASHLSFPDHGQQNAAFLIRLDEGADASQVAKAFEAVVAASDALRSRIEVAEAAHLNVSQVPPSATKIVTQDRQAFTQWAEARACAHLDLSVAAYESVIAAHPEGGISWYLNVHHLVNDGLSAALLLRAVDAEFAGTPLDLKDFYEADRSENFASAEKDAAKSHWDTRVPPPRIARLYDNLVRTTAEAMQHTVLAGSDFATRYDQGIKGPYQLLSAGLSRAVFDVFVSALYVHRLSGAHSFSVGVIVNHRDRLAAPDVIGPMAEIFPVDILIQPGDTHATLHRRVAGAVFETLKNAQPGTAPPQDYDVLVNVLPDMVAPKRLFGVAAQVCWMFSGSLDGAVPLRIMDTPYPDTNDTSDQRRLDLAITDDARGACSASNVMAHFRAVVDHALASPEAAIDSYPLATEDEAQQARVWGEAEALPSAGPLPNRLEAVLKGNLNTVLIEDGEELSGDDLWQWSTRFASHLIRTDAPTRVGIQMTPSTQSVVAVFGTLLAGRSYVPIEPTSPPARIENILTTTKLTHIIDTPQAVDEHRHGAQEPLPQWHAEDEAYVFFTSGSTGTPRGVAISHAGLDNYLTVITERVKRRAGVPIAPLFGSLSFDITVNMLFAPILAGGVLHVFGGHPAEAVVRIAKTRELNWLQATPSHLEILLRFLPRDHNLRTIISGGDALSGRLAKMLDASNPDADLLIVNYYGPTETVVGCIDYELKPKDRDGTKAMPIGKPLPGARLRVMDAGGHPAPLGAIGELWIAFPHMMTSYIGWTPEASGLVDSAEGRFFRSGDLVHFTPDGDLVFHGRADDQMKIGGIRIDATEIEEALTSHPNIARSVVRLIGGKDQDRPTLAAWFQPIGEAPSQSALRQFLTPLVPKYAIPTAYVAIDEVPLTTSGKVDLRGLPSPQEASPSSDNLQDGSRLELTIVGVWQDVLGVKVTSLEDDFFTLGGDSFAALEMILALSGALDQKLDERLAFQETTPATLARALRDMRAEPSQVAAPKTTAPKATLTEYTDEAPPPFTDNEMMFLLNHRTQPDADHFNGGRLFVVGQRFDPQRLERALGLVASAHVPLCWSYGTHRKRLAPDQRYAFTSDDSVLDLENAQVQITALREQRYDLETGPILRVHVQALEGDQTAIAIMGHHVGFDHVSMRTIFRQLLEAYDTGKAPTLTVDYYSMMRARQAECETEARAYWQALTIPDVGELKPLRMDAGGPAGRFITALHPVPASRIRRGAGGPVAQRALAAAALAIAPFVEGTCVDLALVAGRGTDASEDVVGCSTNSLPIWLDCGPDVAVRDVVQQASRTLSEVLPFSAFSVLQVDAARSAVGKTLEMPRFLVSIIERPTNDWANVPVTESLMATDGAIAPMSVFLILAGDEATVGLEYDRRMFNDDVAEQILANLSEALNAVTDASDMRLNALTFSQNTPSLLVADSAAPKASLFAQINAHLEQASAQPAIECGTEVWSWKTLADHVARLTTALDVKGIGPGSRVSVALPRGPLFIASILAIMARRAIYVPIDPSYPADRIDAILEAVDPDLCIVAARTSHRPEMTVSAKSLDDQAWGDIRQTAPAEPLASELAYILFTSGSTGVPNGVPITHGQLSHSTTVRDDVYDDAPARFGLLSSFAFDSSIVGVFWTLAKQGCIVLPPEDALGDLRQIAQALSADLTHVLLVPTLYEALLDRPSQTWPAHVILAGEAVSRTLVTRHFGAYPNTALTNEYGPTEASVWALYHQISPGTAAVPIGHPIPGTWAAVVDANGELCPMGVVGALVIGGPQISAGYWRNEAATAEKFFTTASGDLPAGAAFKTGDRAVLGVDGFQFVGRADDQLNIGGVRLEPSEVEHALAQLDGIQLAVVLATDMRSKEQLLAGASLTDLEQAVEFAKRNPQQADAMEAELRRVMPSGASLVAHVQADATLDISAVRRQISERLPKLHQPSSYVVHADFPRTPNGKIDRRALSQVRHVPAEPVAVAATSQAGVDPEDLTRVTALFRDALRNQKFGPDDSFFEFGGYSLLAMRLLLALEEDLGWYLTTSDLYDAPSPRALCQARLGPNVAALPADPSSHQSVIIPYRREGAKPPIFAVHSLDTNGDLYRPLVAHLDEDQPMYGIGLARAPNLTGDWVTDTNWHSRVEDIAAHYVAELERIAPTGPIILMGYCLGAVYAYEMAQQLRAKGREPQCLVMLNDHHAPDFVDDDQLQLAEALESRFNQIKRAKFSDVPYLVKKVPEIALRRINEYKRQVEIRALKRAKDGGKGLTDRLLVREFVEESYVDVLKYDYLPYLGQVLIVRNELKSSTHDENGIKGWGARIPNSAIFTIKPGPFENFMSDALVPELAKIAKPYLERPSVEHTEPAKPGINVPFRRIVKTDDFEIVLEHANQQFIPAPRPEQRDWMVHQRLNELSTELEHLHALAPSMIAASGTATVEDPAHDLLPDVEIMEDWMVPLMQRMADAVAGPGDDVLEVGFGRGISADMVQRNGVASHAIVECNEHIIADFHGWREKYPTQEIEMIEGMWQDVTHLFKRYDGILFHTYPLDAEELVESLKKNSTFAEEFFPFAVNCLKPGGKFTYFTNEADSLSRAHQRALLKHFSSFTVTRLNDLAIQEESVDAHWYNSIVVVQACVGGEAP